MRPPAKCVAFRCYISDRLKLPVSQARQPLLRCISRYRYTYATASTASSLAPGSVPFLCGHFVSQTSTFIGPMNIISARSTTTTTSGNTTVSSSLQSSSDGLESINEDDARRWQSKGSTVTTTPRDAGTTKGKKSSAAALPTLAWGTEMAVAERCLQQLGAASPQDGMGVTVRNEEARQKLLEEAGVEGDRDGDADHGDDDDLLYVIGGDEAGTGCLGGPLVASVCCFAYRYKNIDKRNTGVSTKNEEKNEEDVLFSSYHTIYNSKFLPYDNDSSQQGGGLGDGKKEDATQVSNPSCVGVDAKAETTAATAPFKMRQRKKKSSPTTGVVGTAATNAGEKNKRKKAQAEAYLNDSKAIKDVKKRLQIFGNLVQWGGGGGHNYGSQSRSASCDGVSNIRSGGQSDPTTASSSGLVMMKNTTTYTDTRVDATDPVTKSFDFTFDFRERLNKIVNAARPDHFTGQLTNTPASENNLQSGSRAKNTNQTVTKANSTAAALKKKENVTSGRKNLQKKKKERQKKGEQHQPVLNERGKTNGSVTPHVHLPPVLWAAAVATPYVIDHGFGGVSWGHGSGSGRAACKQKPQIMTELSVTALRLTLLKAAAEDVIRRIVRHHLHTAISGSDNRRRIHVVVIIDGAEQLLTLPLLPSPPPPPTRVPPTPPQQPFDLTAAHVPPAVTRSNPLPPLCPPAAVLLPSHILHSIDAGCDHSHSPSHRKASSSSTEHNDEEEEQEGGNGGGRIFNRCLRHAIDPAPPSAPSVSSSSSYSTQLPNSSSPLFAVHSTSLPKADAFCPTVAAASVLSKTLKDCLVMEMAQSCLDAYHHTNVHQSPSVRVSGRQGHEKSDEKEEEKIGQVGVLHRAEAVVGKKERKRRTNKKDDVKTKDNKNKNKEAKAVGGKKKRVVVDADAEKTEKGKEKEEESDPSASGVLAVCPPSSSPSPTPPATVEEELLRSFQSHKGYGTANHLKLLRDSHVNINDVDDIDKPSIAVDSVDCDDDMKKTPTPLPPRNEMLSSSAAAATAMWRGGPHPFLHRIKFVHNINKSSIASPTSTSFSTLSSGAADADAPTLDTTTTDNTTATTAVGGSSSSFGEGLRGLGLGGPMERGTFLSDPTSTEYRQFISLRNAMYGVHHGDGVRDEAEVDDGTRTDGSPTSKSLSFDHILVLSSADNE